MRTLAKAVLPQGFSAAGVRCGIKKSSAKDLGLVYSSLPCDCAGVFTANKVKAESLKVCMQQLRNARTGRALIVNSGNANCFMGGRGVRDALAVIAKTAQGLGVSEKSVFIASTGIIGRPLPVEKIKRALPKLCAQLKADKRSLDDFSDAILTTDTRKKTVTVAVRLKNKTVFITGIAKGAGMIYPRLERSSPHATMLAFILTDANIQQPLLASALAAAAEHSFNRISIDGCMSTNDTLLVLANGAAAHEPIVRKDDNFKAFYHGVQYVCGALAKMIVEDAEGATKLIAIHIRGAKNPAEAKKAAQAVMNSDLFKTAMYGNNPNWGRIVAAIGAAGIVLDPRKLSIAYNAHTIFDKGKLCRVPKNILYGLKTICVDIRLGRGRFSHRAYTSDLTPAYIKINAAYN